MLRHKATAIFVEVKRSSGVIYLYQIINSATSETSCTHGCFHRARVTSLSQVLRGKVDRRGDPLNSIRVSS